VRDGAACVVRVEPSKRREGRVVKPCAHAQAKNYPSSDEYRQRQRQGEKEQALARSTALAARTGRPPRLSMRWPTRGDTRPETRMPMDRASIKPCQRPASVCCHWSGQDGQEVVGGRPGQDLRHADGGHDHHPGTADGRSHWNRIA
jgi:hypothetical protein